MDPSRYVQRQKWNTSSLVAVQEQDIGMAPYESYSRNSINLKDAHSEELLLRHGYPLGSTHPRRRDLDYEYSPKRDSIRLSTAQLHGYCSFKDPKKRCETDTFHEYDLSHDKYRRVDVLRELDGYHHHAFESHVRLEPGNHNEGGRSFEHRKEASRERYYNTSSDKNGGIEEICLQNRLFREPGEEKRYVSSFGELSRSQIHGELSGHGQRENAYEEKSNFVTVPPSATVIVRGLSQKTTEGDLLQMLAVWGPFCRIRVIKERNYANFPGFAFIEFPSEDAALKMMADIGGNGLVVDERKLSFQFSSKPTWGAVGLPTGLEGSSKADHGNDTTTPSSDWTCAACGQVNFARKSANLQDMGTDDQIILEFADGLIVRLPPSLILESPAVSKKSKLTTPAMATTFTTAGGIYPGIHDDAGAPAEPKLCRSARRKKAKRLWRRAALQQG